MVTRVSDSQKMGADAQACWRGRVRRPDDVEDVDLGGGGGGYKVVVD